MRCPGAGGDLGHESAESGAVARPGCQQQRPRDDIGPAGADGDGQGGFRGGEDGQAAYRHDRVESLRKPGPGEVDAGEPGGVGSEGEPGAQRGVSVALAHC